MSRLALLEHQKQPFLFASQDLLELLTITESVKTRIAMIESVGPRLTDPKARVDDFLKLFRFVEDKNHVEEALKARAHQLNATQFSAGPANKLMSGGRGGRGSAATMGGGRGGVSGVSPGRGGRGGGGGGERDSASSVTDASPPATPVSSPLAPPHKEPLSLTIPEPVQDFSNTELSPPPPSASPSSSSDSPRISISQHRPSVRLSVVNSGGVDSAADTFDAIPSEMADARDYVQTPDTASVESLADGIPSFNATPSPPEREKASQGAVSRRASLRQSMQDPQERERNSDRISERLSKVEIAVVLAALNMPEREVRESEAHLEEWEMAVVDEKTQEAEHRASLSSAPSMMRRLSRLVFGGTPEEEAEPRASTSSERGTAEQSSPRFGSTVSAPDSSYTSSLPEAQLRARANSSGSGSVGGTPPSSSSSGGAEMPTPVRRNSAKIFSPTRPSPSKTSWFSFSGVSSIFAAPERQTQDFKYASALAYSLNMDRNAFLAMEPETAVEDDEDGNPLYSYKELLRRQYTKMYLGLPIESLEQYLVESEFTFHFGMSKVRGSYRDVSLSMSPWLYGYHPLPRSLTRAATNRLLSTPTPPTPSHPDPCSTHAYKYDRL